MENLMNYSNVAIENESSSSWPLPHQLLYSSSSEIPFEGFVEDKAERVSKSHSQAEKRRRDRINSQLATLRKLIPKSENGGPTWVQVGSPDTECFGVDAIFMDKAALLGSVIEQVKDLKRKAKDISQSNTLLPTEIDEVKVDCDQSNDNFTIIKASVCCDDRPELFTELIRVINGLKLVTVKADIVSVGGRIKSILVLCNKHEGAGGDGGCGTVMSSLKQSLGVILNRIASSSMAASSCRNRSKRQRFFLPESDYHYPS